MKNRPDKNLGRIPVRVINKHKVSEMEMKEEYWRNRKKKINVARAGL
jgi:hypothetical protein